MIFKTPAIRLSFALVLLLVNLLIVANLMGFVPDKLETALELRKVLSESLALQFSNAAEKQEFSTIQDTLRSVVARNDDIRSAAIRTVDGQLIALAGEHLAHWETPLDGKSTPTHVQVPVFRNNKKWATVEIRFANFLTNNFMGVFTNSFVGLVMFLALSTFFCYFLVIKRSLRQLDPTKVIPDRVQKAFNILQEGILILDNAEQIVMANNSFAGLFGKTPNDLVGLKGSGLGWLDHQNHQQIRDLPWLKVLQDGQDQKNTALSLLDSFGNMINLVVNATMITDNSGKCRGSMVTFSDITELEEKNFELSEALEKLKQFTKDIEGKNKDLSFLASHDPLTLCLNRRSLNKKFSDLFIEAQNIGGQISCLMIDIDLFKSVNDRYGHATGDKVIKAVTDVLKICTRGSDLVGRYGGEEFCVVFPGQKLEIALRIAERIRKTIEKEPCGGVNITVSIGVSSIEHNATGPNELLDQADKALYIAKKSGRNRVIPWGTEYKESSESITEKDNKDNDPRSNNLTLIPNCQNNLQNRVKELEGLLEKQTLEITHNKIYDAKTGLPTRLLFEDRIGNEIAKAKRKCSQLAVLSLSLDTIGRIHKTLGYRAAEELLKACWHRLNNLMREDIDIVTIFDDTEATTSLSLINNSEFGVLISDINQVDNVTWIIKRMLDSFEKPFRIKGIEVYISAYFGISIFPQDGQTVEELCTSACLASSHAQKLNSKDRYYFSSKDLNKIAKEQLQIENLLHRAIKNDELELHYQPKIESATGRISGFEALLRWQNESLGPVPPDIFIPIAEQSGQINTIGDWVLYRACQQIRTWLDMGLDVGSVAVNLSGVQLRQQNLVHRIQKVLNEFNLDNRFLEIELTESAFVNLFDQSFARLKQLKKIGLRLTMDDFGTGYSSFSYLRNLPLSCVKIDKTFISDMNEDENALKMVKSIVSLANGLGLDVVAEGVEKMHQADHLNKIGCKFLQGYYYSPPVPENMVPDILYKNENTFKLIRHVQLGG